MNGFRRFLQTSYTSYQAVDNAVQLLREHGFHDLSESDPAPLREGGGYYTVRNGSSLIAFRYRKGPFKILASHTDSPCFKIKEAPVLCNDGFVRLNTEPYGSALRYTFFDRPLRIAGRVVRDRGDALVAESYVSEFRTVIPSVAIHMNRTANENFAPDPQKDLSPLLALGARGQDEPFGPCVSYDLYLVPDEEPFESGEHCEFLSAPRIDDLCGMYASLRALTENEGSGACVCAFFASEEIGNETWQGAASGFLRAVLTRLAAAQSDDRDALDRLLAGSLLVSIDSAHSVHPNRPELCDPTNRAVMGGGVTIKNHAGGAYTTDAMSSAIVKTIFRKAGVRCQSFYNRSDMRSGMTLGTASLGQAGMLSVDLGIAHLAMHSAVETMATDDLGELEKGLAAILQCDLRLRDGRAELNFPSDRA